MDLFHLLFKLCEQKACVEELCVFLLFEVRFDWTAWHLASGINCLKANNNRISKMLKDSFNAQVTQLTIFSTLARCMREWACMPVCVCASTKTNTADELYKHLSWSQISFLSSNNNRVRRTMPAQRLHSCVYTHDEVHCCRVIILQTQLAVARNALQQEDSSSTLGKC